MQTSTKLVSILLGIITLSGCATSSLSKLEKGPETSSIYQHGVSHDKASTEKADRQMMLRDVRMTPPEIERSLPRNEAWSRSGLNEIQQLFPMAENPTITMYVYPHLAEREQVPVPGYTTAFSLYAGNHYALPSELPSNYPDMNYRKTVGISVPPVPSGEEDEFVRSGAVAE